MLTLDTMNRILDTVDELNSRFQIDNYPIYMKNIIETYYNNRCILGCIPMDHKIDAVTNYDPVSGYYVITVNHNKTSLNMRRRLNFTLAHELGHIVLDHEPYYRNSSGLTLKQLQVYEKEADEFAGQFLMPEDIVQCCPKINVMCDRFYVSSQAAEKRLDMIKNRQYLSSGQFAKAILIKSLRMR